MSFASDPLAMAPQSIPADGLPAPADRLTTKQPGLVIGGGLRRTVRALLTWARHLWARYRWPPLVEGPRRRRTESRWRYARELDGRLQSWEIVITPGLLAREIWIAGQVVLAHTTLRLTPASVAPWLAERHAQLHAAGWRIDSISGGPDGR